ncbi:hypothetical protein GINT2_001646 [Glugoides intestinalis]
MLSIWIGFLLGFIAFPILYAAIPGFFGIPKIRQKAHKSESSSRLPITEKLKKEIKKSLVQTTELAWLNVIIQRIYFDTIKNYNFEHKIRQMVLKSFSSSIGEGLLKNVQIIGLNFGCEAPYLRSIKLITTEEYDRITQSGKSDLKACNDEISSCFIKQQKKENGNCLYLNNVINFSSLLNLNEEIRGAGNDEVLKGNTETENVEAESGKKISKEKEPEIKEDEGNLILSEIPSEIEFSFDHIEIGEVNVPKAYKNAVFLGQVEYDGTVQIMFEIELPRGIFVNSTVTLKKLYSEFLFRTPSEGSNTRCEISLINTSDFEIDVHSGLVTGERKLYFQSSISNFLKRTAIKTVKNMVFYPAWLQIPLPIVPSSKMSDFTPPKIEIENISAAINEFVKIQLIISCDFKVLEARNGICHGTSHYKLNNLEYVSFWSFKLQEDTKLLKRDDFHFFEGLNAFESKILYSFATFDILKKVIPKLKDIEIVHKKKGIFLIKLLMNGYELLLVKTIYKNTVIFFRNDSRYSEFLAFKIHDGELQFFNFSTRSSDLYLNTKRVTGIKKIIEDGIKDNVLHQMGTLEASEESDDPNKIERIENIFKKALYITREDPFNVYDATLKIDTKTLKRFLMNDMLRMKNFGSSAKIISSYIENKNISTYTVEYHSEDKPGKECIKVHTFVGKHFIVDCCPEQNIVFIYNFKRPPSVGANLDDQERLPKASKQNRKVDKKHAFSVLHIVFKCAIPSIFPNFFIESLKIQASFQRYFSMIKTVKYEESQSDIKIERYVEAGTIFLELLCDIEDVYSLQIFSCKKQMIIFEVYKVISSKVFTVIYPVEKDYIKVRLVPKFKKNLTVKYKFHNFEYKKNVLIKGVIDLNTGSKLKLPMSGSTSHVLFWEKSPEIILKGYIQDSECKNLIADCGVLRSEDREYMLVFKNKGEKKRNIEIFAGLIEFY